MIPDKEKRKEWRQLAENTSMISAIGKYTPEEVIILIDAVDELERQIETAKECIKKVCIFSVCKYIFKKAGWIDGNKRH